MDNFINSNNNLYNITNTKIVRMDVKMCQGCDWELEECIRLQDEEDLYYVTAIDNEYFHDGHFMMIMVDKTGKIIVR